MCRKLSCQTDNLNWKNQNRDGHYTITATWNAHAHTHSYTQANKWISFYYPWNRTKSERETNMLYNVVYSKSIVWIVSSAPFVVLTPFGYVDQRDNNACEWTRTWESEKKTRANNKFYQPWKSSSSSSSSSPPWSLPVSSCMCAREKKATTETTREVILFDC